MPEESEQFKKLASQAWMKGYFERLDQRGYGHLADTPEIALKATRKQAQIKQEQEQKIQPQIKRASVDVLQDFISG